MTTWLMQNVGVSQQIADEYHLRMQRSAVPDRERDGGRSNESHWSVRREPAR